MTEQSLTEQASTEQTHFGFETVAADEKAGKVMESFLFCCL
ncbi:MAG: hypothetical protein Q9N62_09205 [Ghiorsea sp.]|nr:hypothetical protein [Ghiorsea sp.]